MHIVKIKAENYLQQNSKKGIVKLAKEVNLYLNKKAEIQLDFTNCLLKNSDLILFFKKIKMTYERFLEIVKIQKYNETIFFDLAYGILKSKKNIFNLKNILIFSSILLISIIFINIYKYYFLNWKSIQEISLIEKKIYFMISKYNLNNLLKQYYSRSDILKENQNRSYSKTIYELSKNIWKNCKKFRLNPDLVISLIKNESEYYKFAKSKIPIRNRNGVLLKIDSALGYMQIYLTVWADVIPETAEVMFDEYYNTYWGCYILRHYLDKNNNDLYRALVNYNGGSKINSGDRTIINTISFEYIRKIINDLNMISDFSKSL